MTVQCTDETLNINGDRIHLYKWTGAEAKRIVVLIHGIMMHGKSFDTLAQSLAAAGAIVVAPDLRGFGRCYFTDENEKEKTSISRSQEDLSKLFQLLEEEHPGLPLFCAGESLGAHFARRATALHPELVSGLILSSACLRPRLMSFPLIPHAWSELVLAGIVPGRELNLSPFARQFLKHEPDNLRTYLDDPMSRKSLEVLELIDSLRIADDQSLGHIPKNMPVLVLRGKNDCVCKESSMKKFVDSLKSEKLTIFRSAGCGHLILQANEVHPNILGLMKRWMERVVE